MSQPDTTKWDKNRQYLSKNNDEVWIYIPSIGEWKQFFAQSKISELTTAAVRAYELLLKEKTETK
jgi:IS1 family transposase